MQKQKLRLLFLCSMFVGATSAQKIEPNLKLWYNKPASIWEEALPLGNAKTGAMVFVVGFSSYRTVHSQFFHEIKQRLMTIRKICILRRPVIHFRVDVGGIIAAPRRLHMIVPDALQVGRP